MNIFAQNYTIRKMNEILELKLREVKIIGDIDLSLEDFKHLAHHLGLFTQNGHIMKLFKKTQASMIVFMDLMLLKR